MRCQPAEPLPAHPNCSAPAATRRVPNPPSQTERLVPVQAAEVFCRVVDFSAEMLHSFGLNEPKPQTAAFGVDMQNAHDHLLTDIHKISKVPEISR